MPFSPMHGVLRARVGVHDVDVIPDAIAQFSDEDGFD